jgi:hypothetical protein
MLQRAHERLRLRASAAMAYAGRNFDCVVRDISKRGARLRVLDASLIPEHFELLIKDTGETRPARVRWRRKDEVGVEFTPERRSFGRRPAPVARGTLKLIPE